MRDEASAERGAASLLAPLADRGLPASVLMPGDPDRVSIIASQWDQAEEFALPRGYRAAVGRFRGVAIGAVSSGMGAPSLEIVLTEAVMAGATTVIRVGTTGSLHERIGNGELVVNDASIRLDGMTERYVRPEYPAAASYEVVAALVDACAELGLTYHVGLGATSSSFYAGQGRPNPAGFDLPGREGLLDELRAGQVLNLEMEGAALLTLGRLLGLRTGVIASVIANRATDVWGDHGGIERACLAASTAVTKLAERDVDLARPEHTTDGSS